jgi:hypothetical protein
LFSGFASSGEDLASGISRMRGPPAAAIALAKSGGDRGGRRLADACRRIVAVDDADVNPRRLVEADHRVVRDGMKAIRDRFK